ncbi:MAG: ThiF family adenylyltransferase [Planctomycetota bacterium]
MKVMRPRRPSRRNGARPLSLVVIGGGNIGSQLLPLLAHLPGLDPLTIIDDDSYGPENIPTQAITGADVGRPKAIVQAERLRAMRPDLRAIPLVEKVETVPLGRLQADLILTCVDSRAARLWVNRAAHHLGIPWIDAGVEPERMLCRVSVYIPAEDAACMECTWDEESYALVEAVNPCGAGGPAEASTNAPSCLGAAAASLQAIECRKLLAGHEAALPGGGEVLLDTLHHHLYSTANRRNGECRCDHAPWRIETLDRGAAELTLGELAGLAATCDGDVDGISLEVPGQRFARRLCCPECFTDSRTTVLAGRLTGSTAACPRCGDDMVPQGFSLEERLRLDDHPSGPTATLASLGCLPGDVIGMRTGAGVRRFLLPLDEEDRRKETP